MIDVKLDDRYVIDTTFYLYILKCYDGSYYVGHTDNLDNRFAEHQQGFSYHTKKRLPVELVYIHTFGSRDDAFRSERQIKKWTRKKKEALIEGNWKEISLLAKKKFNKNEKF